MDQDVLGGGAGVKTSSSAAAPASSGGQDLLDLLGGLDLGLAPVAAPTAASSSSSSQLVGANNNLTSTNLANLLADQVGVGGAPLVTTPTPASSSSYLIDGLFSTAPSFAPQPSTLFV